MNVKRKLREAGRQIEDLERRVRKLEARPIVPMITIMPYQAPYVPPAQPWPSWLPVYIGDHSPIRILGASDQTVPPFMAPGTFIS